MGADWAIWADTKKVLDSILIVTDERHQLTDVVRCLSSCGRFVVACASRRVDELMALVRFNLVVVLDDVQLSDRAHLRRVFANRLCEDCEVMTDVVPQLRTPRN